MAHLKFTLLLPPPSEGSFMSNALFDNIKGNKRTGSISSLAIGLVVLLLLSDIPTKEDPSTSLPDECADGIDNDEDGNTDSADYECDPTSPEYDGTEAGTGPPTGGP
jgi:hypothetical protein